MTEAVEKKPAVKPAAEKPKAAAPRTKIAIALHRIDGSVEPGTVVRATAKDYNELMELEAIREPTDAEEALFEKNPDSVVAIGSAAKAAADLDSVLD